MMKAATKQTIKAVVDEAWQGGALNELKNYVRMPCKIEGFRCQLGSQRFSVAGLPQRGCLGTAFVS